MNQKYLALLSVLFLMIPAFQGGQATVIRHGAILPSVCTANQDIFIRNGVGMYWCSALNTWTLIAGGGGSLPSGSIIMVSSGTCPAGTSEVAALDAMTVIGTLAAHGDVGTTGGNNNITPAGTVTAPTFTGSSATTSSVSGGTPAGTITAPTLTMNSYTPTGTVTTPTISWPAGVPTNSSITMSGSTATEAAHTHNVTSNVTATINEPSFTITGTKMSTSASGTAAATAFNGTTISSGSTSVTNPAQTITPTNNAVTSGAGSAHSHTVGTIAASTPTISWPAGVPTNTSSSFTGNAAVLTGTNSIPTFTGSALSTHNHTLTATGTNSIPTFSGSNFDNRSAFTKVIFCQA